MLFMSWSNAPIDRARAEASEWLMKELAPRATVESVVRCASARTELLVFGFFTSRRPSRALPRRRSGPLRGLL